MRKLISILAAAAVIGSAGAASASVKNAGMYLDHFDPQTGNAIVTNGEVDVMLPFAADANVAKNRFLPGDLVIVSTETMANGTEAITRMEPSGVRWNFLPPTALPK